VGALRRLVLVGGVLLAVAALADHGARRLVEDQTARRIVASGSMTEQPDVRISGFPFLTQAAAGTFREITVRSGPGSTSGGVAVHSVRARLDDVQVPVREVLSGRLPEVRAARLQVDGTVPYAAITDLLTARLQGVVTDVQVRYAGDDTLAVSGRSLGVSVDLPLELRLSGSQLVVTVPRSALPGVPAVARSEVALIQTRFTIPPLPHGMTVTTVQAGEDGLTLGATASDLVLDTVG
jgi:hypothetical protein